MKTIENTSVMNTMGVAGGADLNATLTAASLDWEPLTDTLQGGTTGILMPRKKLLYRSDTKAALGVVGEDYAPTNPREFLKTQFEFATSVGGKIARTGFLDGRSQAFCFVRLQKDIEVDQRKKGDATAVYIYSVDGWNGKTPRTSRVYLERLVCTNGMVSREMKQSLWVSHTKHGESRYQPAWDGFLVEATATIDLLGEQFRKLAKTKMNVEQAKGFFETLMPGKTTQTENRRNEMLELFRAGQGNLGVTRYDALNAVTEFVTHVRSYRETDVRDAETNRFLGVFEKDSMRDNALALLLN